MAAQMTRSPVLVTGGAGYIGSHVSWALVDAGRSVIVYDNLSTGLRALVPPQATFVEGDVRDAARLASVVAGQNVGAIIHFAAKTVVPESVVAPLEYYSSNVTGTQAVLEAASKVPAFIFSSTAAVYGDVDGRPVAEDAPLRPVSPYGASKCMAERVLRDVGAASGGKLSYAVLRYFNVAGADPKGRTGQSTPRATHLVKVAAEAAIGRRPFVEVYGTDYPTSDGTCIRDYIHIADLVSAHLAALEHLESGGRDLILNCGYGRGLSVLEIIRAMERASGSGIPIQVGARRLGDATAVIADCARIQRELGWTPTHDAIEDIVGDALAWEKKLPPSADS